jgi:GT2 family glycosyltransferase
LSTNGNARSTLRAKFPARLRRIYRDVRAELLSIGLPRSAEFTQPRQEIEASKDMSVIVAVKDAPAVTRRCLASLQKFAPAAEVIMVDDGSELEETAAMLADFRDRNGWILVRHPHSMGHSRTCESGARVATRPYLCLLNSDTLITPWSWWAAKDAFESDATIGVSGPSTSFCATEQMLPRAMHCRHYWNDSQICAFAERYLATVQPRSWHDLSEAGGFAFFIRRHLWKLLGGLDPNLPDYGNESELCKRVLKRGMRIVWTRNSYIHHFGQQSYGVMGGETINERSRAARNYINEKHRLT